MNTYSSYTRIPTVRTLYYEPTLYGVTLSKNAVAVVDSKDPSAVDTGKTFAREEKRIQDVKKLPIPIINKKNLIAKSKNQAGVDPEKTLEEGKFRFKDVDNNAIEIQNKRYRIWINILKTDGYNDELAKMARCKVPPPLVSSAWKYLVKLNSNNKKDPDLYQKCLTQPIMPETERRINEELKNVKLCEKHGVEKEEINNALIRMQRALSQLLPEVGFDEKSVHITNVLFSKLEESDCFWLMVCLLTEEKLMKGVFEITSKELNFRVRYLDEAVRKILKPLAEHFEEIEFDPTALYSQWFSTLFSESLDIEQSVLFMTKFLYDGIDEVTRISLNVLNDMMDNLCKLSKEQTESVLTKLTPLRENLEKYLYDFKFDGIENKVERLIAQAM